MSLPNHSRVFENDDLALMRTVYDAICAELEITASVADTSRREIVAQAIVEATDQGERDPAVLRARAVARIIGGQ